jgi:hypothetical protein
VKPKTKRFDKEYPSYAGCKGLEYWDLAYEAREAGHIAYAGSTQQWPTHLRWGTSGHYGDAFAGTHSSPEFGAWLCCWMDLHDGNEPYKPFSVRVVFCAL